MIWLLIIIALQLVAIFFLIDWRLSTLLQLLTRASDLTLAAHQRLLGHFEQIESDRQREARLEASRQNLPDY
jgi:hypothetical protein